MRTFLTGPQGLSLSGPANEVGRRLWESLGGSVSLIHSLAWTRTLRPCRHLAARLARGPVLRAGLFTARPLCAAADALAARLPGSFTQDVPPGAIEALDADTMAARLPQLAGSSALRPEYEDGSLTWLLAQAAEKRQFGELQGALVRDAAGEVAGWFLYYCHTGGGLGEVLKLAARRSTQTLVLRRLWRGAWRRGLTGIAGRVEAAFVAAVPAHGSRCGRGGGSLVVCVAAAVSPGPSRPPPRDAVAAASSHVVDLSPHRSRLLTGDLVRWADLVLVMDERQRQMVCDRFGRARRDVVILGDLDPQPVTSRGIEDPVEQSVEVCRRAYARIERCVTELVNALWGGATGAAAGDVTAGRRR